MYNFKKIGKNVTISPKASIYNHENIEIGDNVRIDDFCILSAGDGGIKIGSTIHIACYVSLIGAGRIELQDYCQIGARCAILSSSDDFSGDALVGPQFPMHLRNVRNAPVTLEKYAVLGVGCVVLPGVTIKEGSAVGALGFIKADTEPYKLYVGNPLKAIKDRAKFDWELEYLSQIDWWK